MTRLTLISAALLLLSGCSADPEGGASEPAHVGTTADAPTGVALTLVVERDSIDAAGETTAALTAQWSEGTSIEFIEPRPAAGVLRARDAVVGPVRFDGTRYERTLTRTFDAALPGAGEIAGAGVRIDAPGHPRRVLRLALVPVEVVSLLDPDDSGELEPSLGLAPPPPAPEHGPSVALIAGAAVVAVGALGAVLWLRRGGVSAAPTTPAEPIERLRACVESGSGDSGALRELHHAVLTVPAPPSAARRCLDALERARFAPTPASPDEALTAARDLLDQLAPTPGGRA